MDFEEGIEAEQDRGGSAAFRLVQGAPDKWSSAARGDSDDHVARGNAAKLNRPLAGGDVVLCPFHGSPQGRLATGNNPLDQLGRGLKSGRALAGVQHAQTAAGAGPDIKQPATTPEGPYDGTDGLFDSAS